MNKSEVAASNSEVPMTAKDRVIGIAIGLVLIALCVGMLVWPELGLVPKVDSTGRGGRKVVWILQVIEWVWSRPAGVIAGLVGALVLFGAATNKTKPSE